MKLKNSALQELYDKIFGGGTVTFTVDEESPIDKAFRECDDELSESITFALIKDLQDRNDILEESNKSLLAGNLNLSTEKNILKNRISRLEEMLLYANATLEKVNADRNELQEAFDKLSGENNEITKKRDDAKKNVEYFRDCRDNWRARAKHAEKEVKDLTSQYQKLTEAFDKLSEENKRLNARIDCLRAEVEWYRNHFRENFSTLLDSTRDAGYKQGQNDLWDKLKEVSDYYYFGGDDEFDTDDCEMTSMTDIIDNLNVNQFLEAYKNWHKAQEQHRLDRMRDWLHDFCANRFCEGCPLESNEYKCGRGYSFTGAKPIPDEDIKRYYEKARACSKPLSHWECTLEGTINAEINKDLLNKICGIDSDD